MDGIWNSLDQLRDERALIAHGNWMLVDGEQYVLWHKAMLTYKDDVTAELFDDARFDRYMRKATAIRDMLYKFRMMLKP